VTYVWNFGTPFLSLELFELETSNLACRLITGGTNEKMENYVKGVGRGHVTTFEILGSPPYLGNCLG